MWPTMPPDRRSRSVSAEPGSNKGAARDGQGRAKIVGEPETGLLPFKTVERVGGGRAGDTRLLSTGHSRHRLLHFSNRGHRSSLFRILILDHLAALLHKIHVNQKRDIRQGIAIDSNHVRPLARLESPNLVRPP